MTPTPGFETLFKEGQAQDVPWYDRWSLDNPNLGTAGQIAGTGAYFIPGVGTGLAAWDTIRNLGKSIGNAAGGNWRQAGSNLLGAGASALMMIPVLGGFGKVLTRGGKALQAARAAKGAGRITRSMASLGRVARQTPSMRAATQTAGRGLQTAGNWFQKGAPSRLQRAFTTNQNALARAPRGAGWIQKGLVGMRNLPRRGSTRLMAGMTGLGVASGMMAGEQLPPGYGEQMAQYGRTGRMGDELQNQMFGPNWGQEKQQLQQTFSNWNKQQKQGIPPAGPQQGWEPAFS